MERSKANVSQFEPVGRRWMTYGWGGAEIFCRWGAIWGHQYDKVHAVRHVHLCEWAWWWEHQFSLCETILFGRFIGLLNSNTNSMVHVQFMYRQCSFSFFGYRHFGCADERSYHQSATLESRPLEKNISFEPLFIIKKRVPKANIVWIRRMIK